MKRESAIDALDSYDGARPEKIPGLSLCSVGLVPEQRQHCLFGTEIRLGLFDRLAD